MQQALEVRDESQTADELDRLRTICVRLRQSIDRLIDLAEDGEDVRDRLRQRRGELAQATQHLADVQRTAHGGRVSYGEVEAFCEYLRGELVAEDVPRARRVVRLVTERFVWHGNRIVPHWRDSVL